VRKVGEDRATNRMLHLWKHSSRHSEHEIFVEHHQQDKLYLPRHDVYFTTDPLGHEKSLKNNEYVLLLIHLSI
jgi:hypothetical protein